MFRFILQFTLVPWNAVCSRSYRETDDGCLQGPRRMLHMQREPPTEWGTLHCKCAPGTEPSPWDRAVSLFPELPFAHRGPTPLADWPGPA